MKKASIIILPIILLLFTLIISSCNDGTPDVTEPETPSEAVTNEEITSPPLITTEEVTTEDVITEVVTTEVVTTEVVTTEEFTTEEITTEEITTEEVTIEEVTTEVITTEAPHEHLWGSWKVIKASTCEDKGLESRSCTCGETQKRDTRALGHAEGIWTVSAEATCTADGVRVLNCVRCAKLLQSENIPMKGHVFGAWRVLGSASCTEKGLEERSCICGETQSRELAVRGHVSGQWVTVSRASCTSDGIKEKKCFVCGEILEREITAAYGHSEGWTVTEQVLSCTADGIKHKVCSRCTAILRTEITESPGHVSGEWFTNDEKSTAEISVRQKKCLYCDLVMDEVSQKSLALIEAERVSAAINAVRGENGFTFAAMSDIHVDNVGTGYNQIPTGKSCEFAVKTLSLMEKMTLIDAAAMLGDYTASGHSYSIDHIKADFEYVRKTFGNLGDFPVAWIRGNHEINYYADAERPTTNEELYEYIDSNSRGLTVDPANPKGGYGYIDFPDDKIRMIFLNTSDVYTEYSFVKGEDAPALGVSSAQLRWLAGTALDFSDKVNAEEWGIIINSHAPLDYTKDITRLLLILEAYREGGSGSIEYTLEGSFYSIRYDFGYSARAEIICSIHGHIHNFKQDIISSSDSVEPWLPRLCAPNMCAGRENTPIGSLPAYEEKWGDFDKNGEPLFFTKCHWDDDLGTFIYDEESGTSYCMITVNRDTRTIYAHYVGNGYDRIIRY